MLGVQLRRLVLRQHRKWCFQWGLNKIERTTITGFKNVYLFSQEQKGVEQIKVSEKDAEIIKKIVEARKTGQEMLPEGDESFFSSEETKLSLKIIQIDSLDQLKPLIKEYSDKQPASSQQKQKEKAARGQLLRCKFIVLYKFINLNGVLTAKEIWPIYKQISEEVNLLDQQFLTRFYRIIANQLALRENSQIKKSLPPLPIIQQPTHSNSELLSLLLMVYPMSEDKLYIHYHLVEKRSQKSFKQGYPESQRQVIYDPVHLVHILKHMLYYEDVKKLVCKALAVKNVDQQIYFYDQGIETDDQLRIRQIQAICYALDQQFYDICIAYLFGSDHLLKNLSVTSSHKLLRSILTIRDESKYQSAIIRLRVIELLQIILAKKETFLQFSEEEQLGQNDNYRNLVQILTIMLTNKKQYLLLEQSVLLMQELFQLGSMRWRIKYQEFSLDQIFSILVCYKGCRDYLKAKKGVLIDKKNEMLQVLLLNFKEEVQVAESIDAKQIFYACFFADSFDCLEILKTNRIVKELKQFADKVKSNAKTVSAISQLLSKLNE